MMMISGDRDGEMFCEFVKHSLHKCEDLSSDPNTHIKPCAIVIICALRPPHVPTVKWEAETSESSETDGPSNLGYAAVSRRPVQTR